MKWLLILCVATVAHALTLRGKTLPFQNTTRRSLSANTLFYVKSDRPPSNLVSKEVLGSGVYLVRGNVDNLEHGEWLPELKYDPHQFNDSGPWNIVVRTDQTTLHIPGCRTMTVVAWGRVDLACDASPHVVAQDHRVLWLSPQFLVRALSYESRQLLMGNSFWNGTGTRIAISDTGIDEYHCGFYEGSIAPRCTVNAARQKIVSVCNVPGSDTVGVDYSHGTMCASVAAAFPCLGRMGVAFGAKIAIVDIGVGEDIVPIYLSALRARIQAMGASVHSASWGNPFATGAYTDSESMFDSMAYDLKTFVNVFASGNMGIRQRAAHNGKSGLVAGAVFYDIDKYADFSSQGPTLDGRTVPQVTAPGVNVRVARGRATPVSNHGDWILADGTSFATPAIAALVAIIQGRYVEMFGQLPSAALVEAALIAHAVKPTRVMDRNGNFIQMSITTHGTPMLDFNRWTDVDGLSVQGTNRVAICLLNNDTSAWNVVMRWTDVAAMPYVDVALINDLDMVMQNERGDMVLQDDAKNPYEFVKSWRPAHTRVVVSVFGGASTLGAQPFAIHAKAKTTRTTCASDVLPYEYSTCAGGVRVVTSWDGQTQCMPQSCPQGTCGGGCAFNCTQTACPINDGVGKLDAQGVCRPESCEGPTFLGNVMCECAPLTSAKQCADGYVAACLASKTFGPCVQASENADLVASSAVKPKLFFMI